MKTMDVLNHGLPRGYLMHAGRKVSLQKVFLQNRTDTAEMKYKAYTNKLTSVLRNCENNYYTKLLDQEKTK